MLQSCGCLRKPVGQTKSAWPSPTSGHELFPFDGFLVVESGVRVVVSWFVVVSFSELEVVSSFGPSVVSSLGCSVVSSLGDSVVVWDTSCVVWGLSVCGFVVVCCSVWASVVVVSEASVVVWPIN